MSPSSLAAGPHLVADLPLAALAALGAVLVAGVVALEGRAPGTRARRAVRGALRATILLALLGVVTGLSTTATTASRGPVVVLVDGASRATPEGARGVEDLLARVTAATAAEGDVAIVLPFDARPGVPAAGASAASDARSRLAPALVAARLAAGGTPARVLVVTDGRLDLEGAEAVRRSGEAEGLDVRGVLVPPPPPPPAPSALRVEAIDAPLVVRGPLAVRGAVRTDRPADVRLLVDGVERGRVRVEAPGGEVHFEDQVLAPGSYELALHVVTAGDPAAPVASHAGAGDAATQRPSEETLRRSLTRVRAPQRVVLLTPRPDGGTLRRRLQAQGIDADVATDPASAVAASSAEAFVLDADAALTASPALLETMAGRVEAGAGLLVVAGRDAGAWAAIGQGPLARVLPFVPRAIPAPPPPPPPTPPPAPPAPEPPDPTAERGPAVVAERRPEDALPLTLLLVIDRSGSMSVQSKLAMAIAAAEEAAAQLAPTDRVGVVTFADDATLDLPPRAARDVAVRSLAVGLVASGNTDIYRALSLAHRTMRAETTPIRHVVLLTDGYDTTSSVYGSLPAEYAAERITLTVVGLGRQIDERALKTLARQAGGAFRYAPSAHDLPRILTRDTAAVLHARSAAADAARRDAPAPSPPLVDPTPPDARVPPVPPVPPPAADPPPPPPGPDLRPLRRARPHDSIAGFLAADLPQVGAPLPGTPGPASAVVLEREDAPALVAGRAGLGRVLVLAVEDDDVGLRGWRLLPRLLAQAVRSVAGNLPPADATELRVERTPDGDVLIASMPEGADPEAAHAALEVVVDTPQGPRAATPVPSSVEAAQPGDATERGFALPRVDAPLGTVRVTVRGPDGSRRSLPPISYVPSPPPAPPSVDPEGLARALGGAVTTRPDDPAIADFVRGLAAHRASRPATRATRRSLAVPLLALALALLALDAFAHRAGPSAAAPGAPRRGSTPRSVAPTSTSGVGGPT